MKTRVRRLVKVIRVGSLRLIVAGEILIGSGCPKERRTPGSVRIQYDRMCGLIEDVTRPEYGAVSAVSAV